MSTQNSDFITTCKYTTPEFRAVWPALTGKGALYKGKPKGKYEVKWTLEPGSMEAKTMREHLEIAEKEALSLYDDWEMKYHPFKPDKDKDKKLTGLDSVVFTCSMERRGEHYDIPILDDCGFRYSTNVEIWGGTLMEIRYTPQAYNTEQAKGIRFNIVAIKIVELVNSSTGGGDVKDGFEFKEPAPDRDNPIITRFPIDMGGDSNEKDMAHDEGEDEQEVQITF